MHGAATALTQITSGQGPVRAAPVADRLSLAQVVARRLLRASESVHPTARDGYIGPYIQDQLARIYAVAGEPDKA